MASVSGFSVELGMHQESHLSDSLSNIGMESVSLETSRDSTYLRHL